MSNPHTITTVKCAQCGKVKQESNHWFIVQMPHFSFVCYPFEKVGIDELLGDMRPVCGQNCAQYELETWMTKVRNEPAESGGRRW